MSNMPHTPHDQINNRLSKIPQRPLTTKEKNVLGFIETYLIQHEGVAPSFQEIKEHFGFASFNSVQRYLKQLQNKKYIYIPGGNQKRAITLLNTSKMNSPSSQTEAISLPLLGRVAAGHPIEAFDHDEFVDIPTSLIHDSQSSFALKVEGQSMIGDGILDGDIIFVQSQSYANNGDIVVADVNNEATVKRYYFHNKKTYNKYENNSSLNNEPQIELRPSNQDMHSMWFKPHQVKIKGIVVSLIRKF